MKSPGFFRVIQMPDPFLTAGRDYVLAFGNLSVIAHMIDSCLEALAAAGFMATTFEWSVNLKGRSTVSIQISTEDFYKTYPERAVPADVHGILMRVASLEDTLRGKLKAWTEPGRRPSKRQKDLADIFRLVEAHPHLRPLLPEAVVARLDE